MRIKGRTSAIFGTIFLVLMALVLAPTSFASCSTGVEENEDVVADPTATSTSTPTSTLTPIPEPTQTPTPTAIPTPTPRTISFLDEAADAGTTRLVVGGASDYVVGASFILNFGKETQEQIKIASLGFERRPNRGVHVLIIGNPLKHPHQIGESVSEEQLNTEGALFPHHVPQGLASSSRTISDPQIPSNVLFNFDPTTSKEDQDAIRLGVERASQIYSSVFEITGAPMTFTTIPSGCPKGVVATYISKNTLCVDTSHPQWTSRTFELKMKTGLHEYFHNVQDTIGCQTSWDLGYLDPVWLMEGSAEFYAYWGLSESGMTPLTQTIHQLRQSLRASYDLRLTEMETPSLQTFSYSLATLAVDLLVSKSSITAYIGYCELRSSGIEWKSAFEQAFGITSSEFYEQFELYRSNGYK